MAFAKIIWSVIVMALTSVHLAGVNYISQYSISCVSLISVNHKKEDGREGTAILELTVIVTTDQLITVLA